MDSNPYLPPEALVADRATPGAETAPAFAVSITKLVVMNVATLGMYQLYWFYMHWVAIRRRTGEQMWPFWRAFFALFWCYSCFSHIHEAARRERVDRWLSVGGLTAGWAITSLLSRLPDPWWMVSLLAFVFLIPVQREANGLNAKLAPEADRNARFSWLNIVWLVIAGLFWMLLIVGLTLPDPAAA